MRVNEDFARAAGLPVQDLLGSRLAESYGDLGPDRGVDDSIYFRDPNGVGLELYCEELGIFDCEPLV